MLYSKDCSAIYLKTTRPASTSTELFLQRAFGLSVEKHPAGGHLQVINEAGVVGSRDKGVRSDDIFRNHMAPSEVRRLLGEVVYKQCVRIANIRNPWDSFVSRVWFWDQIGRAKLVHPGNLTRNDVDRALTNWERPQVENEILDPDPELAATRVICFEFIQSDLALVSRERSLTYDSRNLEHSNSVAPPQGASDHRSLFTPASRRQIEDLYADWIEFGQYAF